MKVFIILIIFFPAIFFIRNNQKKISKKKSRVENINNQRNVFIVKIDSLDSVYIIYAKKNDSIFKIVSKRDQFANCKEIKVGNSYILTFYSVFPEKFYQKREIAGVKYNGTMILLNENGIIWDLFVSKNLKGLCLVKD